MHFLARPSCGVKFLLFLSVSQNLWTFSISAVEKQKTQRRTTKATTTTTTTTTPAEEETIEIESDVIGHNGSSNFQDPFRDLVSILDEDGEAVTNADGEILTRSTPPTTSSHPPTPPPPCPAPNVTYNGSLLSGSGASDSGSSRIWTGMESSAFRVIRDVEFEVRVGPFATDLQKCKLTCIGGQWVGPLCRSPTDHHYKVLLKSCELNFHPPHTIITYQYQELKLRESTLFPNGANVEFRCEGPLGHDWAMEGNSSIACNDGDWNSRIPACRRTSSKNDFSEDLSPRISIHTVSGYSTVGPSGELLVYPGSIIHLDCLYKRKLGNPEWILTKNNGKSYPTGWYVSDGERDWQYRMSLYYVKAEDANIFTCQTPRRQQNSVNLVITEVECSDFAISDMELESRLQGRKIGAEAAFSCPTGFTLIGKPKLHCLSNGEWSSPPPHCLPVRCPALEILDPHLRVLALNNSYQGQATFLCPFGYKLTGPDAITCGSDGRWTGFVPQCRAIECPAPLPPSNGRLIANGHYLVGHTVQYMCDEGFVLIGEPIIRCTEAGLWSHAPPFCKRACRFPGDPSHGRITPVKFLYEVGDKILIQCNSGFVNTGRQKLQCTDNGGWSDRMPTCLSYLSSSP